LHSVEEAFEQQNKELVALQEEQRKAQEEQGKKLEALLEMVQKLAGQSTL